MAETLPLFFDTFAVIASPRGDHEVPMTGEREILDSSSKYSKARLALTVSFIFEIVFVIHSFLFPWVGLHVGFLDFLTCIVHLV